MRQIQKVEGPDDKLAKENVIFMNSKLNDFKEKYYSLKDRQIREYNKAKRRVEKKKKKLGKEKEKLERRKKRKQEKLEKLKKQQEAANPFDVKDEENEHIGENGPPAETTLVSDSDTESSHSDSSESEASEEDSDEDGLHAPKSMHELRLQKQERKRVKNNKKREKELKKIMKQKKKAKQNGGFLRNSVLVKTLNFFGRSSKPQELVKEEDEDEVDQETKKLDTNERKSDMQPQLNDFFVQTSSQKAKSDNESQKENIFGQANKEVDIEFFKQNSKNSNGEKEHSDRDEESDKENDEEKEDSEEEKDKDPAPIFNYQEKKAGGLPPLAKGNKKFSRQSTSGVKKIMAPPKSNSRHSVLQKVDLLDLLEN